MECDGVVEDVAGVRDKAVLALDVDDLVAAMRLARLLRPYFATAKVGLELFSASGPEAIEALLAEEYRVFVDLKLYDIPTTVARAAKVVGSLGASYLTLHLQGGGPMVIAGVEGFAEGARSAGATAYFPLGVTVLTSQPKAPPEEIQRLAAVAVEGGCWGVVCAATDVPSVRAVAPGLTIVVAGIRPPWAGSDDQARPATLGAALDAGADLVVVGRAVTSASDPVAAANAIFCSSSSEAI
jgi:orotidine-5'-phosphate decarboxylase